MKNLVVGIVLGLILGSQMCCSSNVQYANSNELHQDKYKSILDNAYYSTVKLQANDLNNLPVMAASGFPIDKERILTAGHFCSAVKAGHEHGVLEKKIDVMFVNRNKELSTLKGGDIQLINSKIDLCIVKMKYHGVVPFKFSSSYSRVRINDEIIVVGAPIGFFPVTVTGRVITPKSTELPDDSLNNRLIISAVGTYGNSGGPILNKDGEVIGVVMAKLSKYDNILFAVTLDQIKFFLKPKK